MRRAVRLAGSACAVPVLAAACATPALNRGAFVENGKGALQSAISATASASLALEARLAGSSTRAYSDTVVTDSEKSIAPIEASFGGVDPPTEAEDTLRDDVLKALGDAGDALADARIAIRRDDEAAMATASDELTATTKELSDLQESLG